MPSFDIVSEVDLQKLDNAVNATVKEFSARFDFNGSATGLELDKKLKVLKLETENEMRIKAVQDMLIGRLMKQGLEPDCLDFGPEQQASGNMVRKEIKIKEGIDKELSKKIIKAIKDTNMKVQASVMDNQVRVTAKKIDDLQSVIAFLKKEKYDQPIQFTNFRS